MKKMFQYACQFHKIFNHILIVWWLQFKNAGIIEMEASIKACRVLIMQQVGGATVF